MRPLLCLLTILIFCECTFAQKLVADWTFHPNYTLYRNAANYPGNKIDPPKSRFEIFKTVGDPIHYFQQKPTDRLINFMESEEIPDGPFSVELWLINHVNLPVGAMICARNQKNIPWLMGYFGKEVSFSMTDVKGKQHLIKGKVEKAWKKYWVHLVGTWDGEKMTLYLNGKKLGENPQVGVWKKEEGTELELAGYFEKEPYMINSNLVKAGRIYEGAMGPKEINKRFAFLQSQVENGFLFPDTLHFNAGPYLHLATQHTINILWETNQLTKAKVRYGRTLPLDQVEELEEAAYIQEIQLKDLAPATPYYYEIEVENLNGQKMSSGILTFGTAGREDEPISFCLIGDTESRPQINNRLGEMIWEERPNFILHLGDITDGGKKPHKFEWNYEYFTGIIPVASRIPVFPVPGNGEGDLYWYKKYHKLPGNEAYYTFSYGNADFFMLNSNAANELKNGGAQYEWLKKELASSEAEWKFIAHHHCPISSDENDFGNTWAGEESTKGDPRFDALRALYEKEGVDVVFFGHVHAFERTYPMKGGKVDDQNGVVYIKSGGAGGHLEDFVPTHNSFTQKNQRGHHYCKVDIFKNHFVFRMYDIEGRLKDYVEWKK
ncbi:MAG: metallophosphoesterase [Bacteroidota bacterium]